MQNRFDGILRAINNDGKRINILTFPTHEASQSELASMPHRFYLFQAKDIKKWNSAFRKLPDNFVLLTGKDDQICADMQFDMVLSQSKFGQFQYAKRIADRLNIPLISIEHTLPVKEWTPSQLDQLKSMRGDINIFITDYQKSEWGWPEDDSSVRMIPCTVDTDKFTPGDNKKNGTVLTVVNDYINRDYFCGYKIYERITKGLKTTPLGDTPGFSKPAKDIDDLVDNYRKASVFLNTTTRSTMPVTLLEAMSAGCPIVTTNTCSISECITDGVNGFASNDEGYLREKLEWCINNPDEAAKIGAEARKTAIDRFHVTKYRAAWEAVFQEALGKVHNQW